ncbi:MAG: hypothetical protein ACYC96_03315 [Fimbriimonadaceae bacterium]
MKMITPASFQRRLAPLTTLPPMLNRLILGKTLALAGLALMACFGLAQQNLLGPHQYPAFRTLSGLPGGGFGVRPDGTPAFDGAMAFSTPIGYSLSNWHGTLTGANASDYWFFRLPHVTGSRGSDDSLGKASGCGGLSFGHFGSLSGSFMVISSELDLAFNLEYQTPLFYKNIGVGVGVQDIAGRRGDRAGTLLGFKGSQSFFGAVTVPLTRGIYASAGWGTRRFSKGFANMSVPIGDRFKAVVEEDGLGVNEAIAWDPKAAGSYKLFGRHVVTTAMIGFVASHYAFWSLNFGM